MTDTFLCPKKRYIDTNMFPVPFAVPFDMYLKCHLLWDLYPIKSTSQGTIEPSECTLSFSTVLFVNTLFLTPFNMYAAISILFLPSCILNDFIDFSNLTWNADQMKRQPVKTTDIGEMKKTCRPYIAFIILFSNVHGPHGQAEHVPLIRCRFDLKSQPPLRPSDWRTIEALCFYLSEKPSAVLSCLPTDPSIPPAQ